MYCRDVFIGIQINVTVLYCTVYMLDLQGVGVCWHSNKCTCTVLSKILDWQGVGGMLAFK